MCEMAVWYFEYANFNSTGRRPIGVTLWAVTFTTVKKTLSRLLLLVVSMGFGVVRPTLGGITSRVLLLGFFYFIACEALELVEHMGNVNDFSKRTELLLIFSSLSKTLEKLQVIYLTHCWLVPSFFVLNSLLSMQVSSPHNHFLAPYLCCR
ncbi:unnamed protein product [Linum tenue]|uniref:GOST seven transmembrane domain-containing protein n=1 Tax=Linum tenue TaxID=586396 RepID=A0AAV0KNL2_9ROSI|nr:unnamed protein product [Linum tenue]